MSSNKEAVKSGKGTFSSGRLIVWLLLALSILMNLLVFNRLIRLQRSAQTAINDTRDVLVNLQGESFALTIPVEQTVVLDTNLPINEIIAVPIKTTIPIKTDVTVIVNAKIFGDIPIHIPIESDVPIDVTMDVPVSQTFAIRAPVEIDADVPVEIAVADTPLLEMLIEMDTVLGNLASQLEP